jgi:hypothetical protein
MMRRPRSARAALAALALGTGCGLPLAERASETRNTCGGDGDCPGGSCAGGLCVAREADLSGLIVEVNAPGSAKDATATVSFVDLGALLAGSSPAWYVSGHAIELPPGLSVKGKLVLEPVPPKCEGAVAADGSVPVSFELYPRLGTAGLPAPTYAAQARPPKEGGSAKTLEAEVRVPVGRYDVYMVPLLDAAGACQVPSLLQRDLVIESAQTVQYDFKAPLSLAGSVRGYAVGGWTARIVDDLDGRVLSTSAVVSTDGHFGVELWPEIFDASAYAPFIELTPPREAAGQGVPTALWSLGSVVVPPTAEQQAQGIDYAASLSFDAALAGAQTIDVEGAIISDEASSERLTGVVAIFSNKLLDGNLGAKLYYATIAESDVDGGIAARLLPGTYDVLAKPSDGRFSIGSASWVVKPGDLGGGRAVVVAPKATLSGAVRTAHGATATGIPYSVQPSASRTRGYREELQLVQVQPSTAAGLTDEAGVFRVGIDLVEFDLSVEPDATTGLPWLVRPRFVPATESPMLDLEIPYPVVLEGALVTASGARVADAVLRAWLPLPLTAEEMTRGETPVAVQIGSAVSDGGGNYRLVLPPSISR